MSRNLKKFILMYGLFIGWLMSFIYSGPLFSVVVDGNKFSHSVLFAVMFLIPAAVFFVLGNLNIDEKSKRVLLPLSIAVCIVCSVIYLIAGQAQYSVFIFAVLIITTLTAGILTMFFIISSTAYFIKFVPFKDAFKAMALIILIANTCFYVVEVLVSAQQNTIAVAANLVMACTSLALAWNIKDAEEIERPDYDISTPKKSLLIICAAFFLLNIGGGVVFSVVEPAALETGALAQHLYILPYILAAAAMLIISMKVLKAIDILLTVAAGFVAIGLLLFKLSDFNALLTNMFIQIGYAMLDIILWGLVGKMSFVYGKPYKIVSLTMSSNITAVFLGMAGARILVDRFEDPSLAITLIATVCIIAAIMAMPFIHRVTIKDLKKGMENIRSRQRRIDDLAKLENIELLTVREREIAVLLAAGDANRSIAQALYISENTLKTHAKRIYNKLGIKNKKELQNIAQNMKRIEKA